MSSQATHEAAPFEHWRSRIRYMALASCVASLAAGAVLAFMHSNYGGPGDALRYYAQASRLLPFVDNYYGPGYFVALRLVHDLAGLSWFASGRLLSWLSACVVLVLSARLLESVLPKGVSDGALTIVALSPDFISQSYSSATFMYGTAWVLLPILILSKAKEGEKRPWLLAGFVFGIASLSRFQSVGFLLGAVCSLAFARAVWPLRLRSVLLLLGSFLIPVVAWSVFLLVVQGFVPKNYNFVHLTGALGEFRSFHEVDGLVRKYGSLIGVLRADPMNLPRIVLFGFRSAALFPFQEALAMFALAAAWIIPGVFVSLAEGKYRSPWFGALALGFVLTGIGSKGWTFYYIPCLPLMAFLIAGAIEAQRGRLSRLAVNVNWAVVLCSVLVWSVIRVPRDFASVDWPEWTAVRTFLNGNEHAEKVVTTASSLAYGAKFAVLDQDTLLASTDSVGYLSRLKSVGATHLVVSERHTLWEYPWMKALLFPGAHPPPPGLQLDTLIVLPHRVAVYRLTDSY